MQRIKILYFLCFVMGTLNANEVNIHEGLITAIRQVEPILAVSSAPPLELQEEIPIQPNSDFIWLPGYWVWSQKTNEFVWVKGFWRRPPPEKIWVKGKWLQQQDYWIWLKGFWADQSIGNVAFIKSEPPDSIEDAIEKPLNEKYFWVPGHYHFVDGGYKWSKGYWEAFDKNWVLVPAHYEWRPDGYFFIAAYWDWPLEARGAYSTLSTKDVIKQIFYLYPDYLVFFEHYNHFNPRALSNSPPWWSWQTWWTYNWSNQWALWWWYTHPGYIQPKWMTKEISSQIAPPSKALEIAIKQVIPPLIVTENGVISNKRAAKAVRKLENTFILPINKLAKFRTLVLPRLKNNFKALIPHGKTNAMLLSRPQFVLKERDEKLGSPIKPYLKKLRNKLHNYEELAVDNSTTEMQKNWEEEIRNRDKRRSAIWQQRRQQFNERSAGTTELWDEGVRERNQERGSYADETYRHQQLDLEEQQFWQPQMDARQQEYKEEREAIEQREKEHYQLEQEYQKEQEAIKKQEGYLSYSSYDARRDAMRSDNRRYMQKRADIKRDNMRYMQNKANVKQDNKRYDLQQQNIKRENLRYEQHQEDLKQYRLKQEQQTEEKKKEDERFWEELRKLEVERGDAAINDDEKWWLKKQSLDREELQRQESRESEEKFWEEQEREKEEARKRSTDVQFDIPKYGAPLPQSKED